MNHSKNKPIQKSIFTAIQLILLTLTMLLAVTSTFAAEGTEPQTKPCNDPIAGKYHDHGSTVKVYEKQNGEFVHVRTVTCNNGSWVSTYQPPNGPSSHTDSDISESLHHGSLEEIDSSPDEPTDINSDIFREEYDPSIEEVVSIEDVEDVGEKINSVVEKYVESNLSVSNEASVVLSADGEDLITEENVPLYEAGYVAEEMLMTLVAQPTTDYTVTMSVNSMDSGDVDSDDAPQPQGISIEVKVTRFYDINGDLRAYLIEVTITWCTC